MREYGGIKGSGEWMVLGVIMLACRCMLDVSLAFDYG